MNLYLDDDIAKATRRVEKVVSRKGARSFLRSQKIPDTFF
jgi:hypothetical protein